MGGQGGGDPGEQAAEGVGSVTGELKMVGDVPVAGLDPVAQRGNRAALGLAELVALGAGKGTGITAAVTAVNAAVAVVVRCPCGHVRVGVVGQHVVLARRCGVRQRPQLDVHLVVYRGQAWRPDLLERVVR